MILGMTVGIVIALLLAIVVGRIAVKVSGKRYDKKLLDDAKEVMAGKKDNKISIDGKVMDVNRFSVKDDKEGRFKISFGATTT